ncbi:MAG: Aspartokinase [Syntrophorhabdus sp. PtaB.Bin184]|jgi:aspartate kinase|nr:MAG: Aspartokinase [Syntrophorhabdus sp. PtaB.Bin184]
MLVVQKYGGTSVRDVQRIQNVARRAVEYKSRGMDVIVVVSAMSGETDRLLNMAHEIAKFPDEREVDVLISTGEQVTSALLAITLREMGHKAVSLLADQIRIISDSSYGTARIASIEDARIRGALKEGNIIVVPGFQGVDDGGNITTLGRGGSDTTAVALAAALKADLCEIYTDVDGVYTTDPNICEKARRLDKISYEEMLEMASLGAKVLQIRSVELAQKYNVPILVKSSLVEGKGTLVCKEDMIMMEKVVISGITYNKNEAKITINQVPDKPGIASKIFSALSAANIVVDMIVQNVSHENYNDITFTVVKADGKKAFKITDEIGSEIGAKVAMDEDMAKVSIVGLGMRSHSGVASRMFTLLANEGINIELISTSEIKISCVIESKYGELAVRALHKGFDLDAADITEES